MTRYFPDMGERGVCAPVALFETEQLGDFCLHCDVVVNCAGPSKKILDRVPRQRLNMVRIMWMYPVTIIFMHWCRLLKTKWWQTV